MEPTWFGEQLNYNLEVPLVKVPLDTRSWGLYIDGIVSNGNWMLTEYAAVGYMAKRIQMHKNRYINMKKMIDMTKMPNDPGVQVAWRQQQQQQTRQ